VHLINQNYNLAYGSFVRNATAKYAAMTKFYKEN